MVSIAAFQAVDPGSIPGRRNALFFFITNFVFSNFLISWSLFAFCFMMAKLTNLVPLSQDVLFKALTTFHVFHDELHP